MLMQVSSVCTILSQYEGKLFLLLYSTVADWRPFFMATQVISTPCCWGSVCRQCIHPFSIPLRVAGDYAMQLFPTRNLQLPVDSDQHISNNFYSLPAKDISNLNRLCYVNNHKMVISVSGTVFFTHLNWGQFYSFFFTSLVPGEQLDSALQQTGCFC